MSWAVGYDEHWKRDIGYGVPAFCDHPECSEVIDRGLAHVCAGGTAYGGYGCGLYFCERHRSEYNKEHDLLMCERCAWDETAFTPKPDHPDWIKHKATDPSWAEWRREQQSTSSTT